MQNKAAVMHGTHDVRLEDVPVPEPGPKEVMVEIRAVGVCGSDVHYYEEGRIGSFVVREPLILGHESMGTVVALGEEATKHEVGERVTLEPGVPDGTCRECRAGRYNLCPNVRFFATPPIDGAFTNYVSIHEDFAFRLARRPLGQRRRPDGATFGRDLGLQEGERDGRRPRPRYRCRTDRASRHAGRLRPGRDGGHGHGRRRRAAGDRTPPRRDARPERSRGASGGGRHGGRRPDRMFGQRAGPRRRHPPRQAGRRRGRGRDGPERRDERAARVHPDQRDHPDRHVPLREHLPDGHRPRRDGQGRPGRHGHEPLRPRRDRRGASGERQGPRERQADGDPGPHDAW